MLRGSLRSATASGRPAVRIDGSGDRQIHPALRVSSLRRRFAANTNDRPGVWQAEAQNFGKLDRLGDSELQQFKEDTLGLKAAGKSYSDWRNFVTR